MNKLWQDAKYGLRMFVKNPGFTAVAVLILTMGIGVTTAVFTIFNGVLLAPLPFPDPEELVMVFDTQPACDTCPASFPKYHDWRERNQVFAAIGGSTYASFVLTGDGEALRVLGVSTTASLADVFGVRPQIGHWYTEQEDQPGGPAVAVLQYGFWKRQFQGDPAILGRKLILGGVPYEVIGVMPEKFTHRGAELFVPLQRKLDPATRGNHFLSTYARLKKGITPEQGAREMRLLGEALAREFGHNHGIDVVSYRQVVVGDVRRPLNFLLGAVLLLLLIASVNIANLLLASGLKRRRELAIRLALGARRWELAQQLATESILMSLAGGVLGVLLAQWLVSAFVVLAGNQLPRAASVEIDARVLAFTAIVSIAVGVFCSIWPIVVICRKDLASAVREGDVRSGTHTGKKMGNSFVVAEIALAFGLLLSSGLLVKNFFLLRHRDPGVRTDRIVTFDVAPSGTRYQAPEQILAFYREFYARLTQVSDVESAGLISHLPMYNFGYNGEFQVEGNAPWGPNEAPLVEYRWLYGNYLNTLGVPLLKGRMLDERDGRDARAVLINRAMAEKFWPGQDPMGRRFGQGSDVSEWFEVVGVVGDIRSYGLERSAPYEFYRTIEQSPFAAMTVVIRTRSNDPTKIVPSARQILQSIDPSLPITKVQTMEQVVADSVGQPRLISALTSLFGALAGLLAMVGVYSVMAYNVQRQRHEFGIRIALGATQGDVQKVVLGRGVGLAAVGTLIGGFGGWLLSRVLSALLHDVKPTDSTVFAATSVVVLLVALIASYLPARSASHVNPIDALRYE